MQPKSCYVTTAIIVLALLLVVTGTGLGSRQSDQSGYGRLLIARNNEGATLFTVAGITQGNYSSVIYPHGHKKKGYRDPGTVAEYLKENIDEFKGFAPPDSISPQTPDFELAKFNDMSGAVQLITRLDWEVFQVDSAEDSGVDIAVHHFRR